MNILVFAPHPDDEILGVGGTIAKRAEHGTDVYVCIVTKGYPPLFCPDIIETGRGEAAYADRFLGAKDTIFLDFPALTLEKVPLHEIASKIGTIIKHIAPEEIYIPHCADIHKDHQIVAEAVMIAARPKYDYRPDRIYAYETLSETGWNIPAQHNEFIPTVYEDITSLLSKKITAMSIYQSQLEKFPSARSLGAIESLAHYRGAVANVEAAEAFMLIREIKR